MNIKDIKHPAHYAEGRKYEPIKVIQDWDLDFALGNAIKYIARAGRKEGNSIVQDLMKAKQYLEFEIDYQLEQVLDKVIGEREAEKEAFEEFSRDDDLDVLSQKEIDGFLKAVDVSDKCFSDMEICGELGQYELKGDLHENN